MDSIKTVAFADWITQIKPELKPPVGARLRGK
jgi:hypothetical protein